MQCAACKQQFIVGLSVMYHGRCHFTRAETHQWQQRRRRHAIHRRRLRLLRKLQPQSRRLPIRPIRPTSACAQLRLLRLRLRRVHMFGEDVGKRA